MVSILAASAILGVPPGSSHAPALLHNVGLFQTTTSTRAAEKDEMGSPQGQDALADAERQITALFANFDCRNGVFIDAGTNIGVSIRKFFEPSRYPGAGLLDQFNSTFGHGAFRRDAFRSAEPAPVFTRSSCAGLCAIGFEPGPSHTERLDELTHKYQAAGAGVVVIRAALSDATTELHFEVSAEADASEDASEDRGASEAHPHTAGHAATVAKNTGAGSAERTVVAVPALDFSALVRHVHRQLAKAARVLTDPPPRIFVKMDVEGSEYNVLSRLMRMETLHHIDRIAIEWHHLKADDGSGECKFYDCPPKPVAALNSAIRQSILASYGLQAAQQAARQGFRLTAIVDLDDETYSDDGMPWPAPHSLACRN